MFKTEQDINTLTQLRYAPLVGKAFKGRDYMADGNRIVPPPAPFFVYSLPPISWNRDGMSFNPYQLPILRMGIDNEYGGEDCPVLMIDTIHTDVFKQEIEKTQREIVIVDNPDPEIVVFVMRHSGLIY